MANTKQKELTKWLPPTAVTPGMRKLVEKRARMENITISELQRRALTLFLSNLDTNPVNGATNHRNLAS